MNTRSENEIEKDFEKMMFESSKKMEMVEVVAQKLEKKYERYKELKNFIEYLKGIEKIFRDAESGGWEKERIKEELIGSYIYLLSVESNIDQNVFNSIYSDFKSTYTNISSIYEIASNLANNHPNPVEKEFIEYLRDIYAIFNEAEENGEDLLKTKEKVIQTKMKSLSDKGLDQKKMEEIFEEFKKELNKK